VHSAYETIGERGLTARWKFPGNATLVLTANLGEDSLSVPIAPNAPVIYASEELDARALKRGTLPSWSVAWFLES